MEWERIEESNAISVSAIRIILAYSLVEDPIVLWKGMMDNHCTILCWSFLHISVNILRQVNLILIDFFK